MNQKTGTEWYFFDPQVPRSTFQTMNVVLRTTQPSQVLSPYIEQIVREVDRNVPVVRFRDMDDVFSESIQRPRMLAELVGVFAGLALLLAAIGTYGVLSYVVAERRREIGIRLALGAARTTVLGQVMKEGLSLTIIGIIAGLSWAFAMNRLLAAWRASRLDPNRSAERRIVIGRGLRRRKLRRLALAHLLRELRPDFAGGKSGRWAVSKREIAHRPLFCSLKPVCRPHCCQRGQMDDMWCHDRRR